MATSTQTSTLTQVSLANLFGIFISVVLTILFVVFGAHALKYLKTFACKIKIIVNRVNNKNIALKDFNYKTRGEQTKRSPNFDKMEMIFKNEVVRSRSLEFFNIVHTYMSKYNHLLYYPFRDRLFEKYDLLKPRSTFFNLLVVSTVCVCWMLTIFFCAVLNSFYSDISTVSVGRFVGLTIAIGILSTVLNLIIINRLFGLYLITIKNAFRVDYGHKYKPVNEVLEDQKFPKEEDIEEAEKQQKLLSAMQERSDHPFNDHLHKESQPDQINANSTRKLLGEEIDQSDYPQNFQTSPNDFDKIEQKKEPVILQTGMTPGAQRIMDTLKNKAIKDMFELQVKIEGIELAKENEKYIYLYDRHAIGDKDFLHNEALKAENKSNIITVLIMFIVFSCSAIACCFLNYKFEALLSRNVFFIFAGAFLIDMLIFRMLGILLMSALRFFLFGMKGYRKLEYQQKKQVNVLLRNTIQDIFRNSQTRKFGSQLNSMQSSPDKKKIEDMSQESILKEAVKNYMSQNHQDLSSSMHRSGTRKNEQFKSAPSIKLQKCYEEEQKREADEEAQIVLNEERKSLDNPDEEAEVMLSSQNNYHDQNTKIEIPNSPDENQFEMVEEEKENNQSKQTKNLDFLNPFKEVDNNLDNNNSLPSSLMKSMERQLEKSVYDDLMAKKQIVPDLTDYNLFLLRKIFDGFDERAEKVLENFRSDKNNVLRKRYMVPIVNPNYPFEKLLEDIKLKQEHYKLEHEEEEGFMEGEKQEVQEEMQEPEGITVEMKSKLKGDPEDEEERLKVKESINKYGKKIKDVINQEFVMAMPQPYFEREERKAELEITDKDEDTWEARKLELERLRQMKREGQELTEEEQKRLVKLEQEEDKYRNEEIEKLMKKQKRTNQEEERLKKLQEEESEYRNRRIDELYEKKQNEELTEEEEQELRRLEEWRKLKRKKEMEELMEKKKKKKITKEELRRIIELEEEELSDLQRKLNNGEELTDEELRRLEELERIKKQRIISEIEELEKKGDKLTNEEKLKLIQLQKEKALLELQQLKRKNPPLSEEDLKRMRLLEEELERLEMKELQLKQEMGKLTDEEIDRLKELETRYKMKDLSIIEGENENQGNESAQIENPFDKEKEEEQKRLEEEAKEQEEAQKLKEDEGKDQEEIQKLNEEGKEGEGEELEGEKSEQSEMAYSRITDKDNFANLPPVEVLGNKPTSPLSNKNREQKPVEEDDKKQEQLNEDLQKLDQQKREEEQVQIQKALQEQQEVQKQGEQEMFEKQDLEKGDQQMLIVNQDEEQKKQKEKEQQENIEQEKEKSKMEENKEILNESQKQELEKSQHSNIEQKEGDQSKSEINKSITDKSKEEVLNQSKDKSQANEKSKSQQQIEQELNESKNNEQSQKLNQSLNEQDKSKASVEKELLKQNEQMKTDEEKLLLSEKNDQSVSFTKSEGGVKKDQSQEQNEQANQSQNQSVLSQKEAFGENSKQNQEQDKIKVQDDENLDQNNQNLKDKAQEQEQKQTEQLQKLKQNEEIQQQEALKNQQEQEALQQQQLIDQESSKKLNQSQDQNDKSLNKSNPQLNKSIKDLSKSLQNSKEESYYIEQEAEDQQQQQSQSIINRPSTSESQLLDHRPTSDRQTRLQQQQQLPDQDLDQELENPADHSPHPQLSKPYSEIPRETQQTPIQQELLNSPENEQDESIYSHKTTSILDEEKVSFMHIEHLPHQDGASDDSFSEQDMVYYNKDDLTNYSKGLGLNRVRVRNPNQNQNYFSENDLQEVEESDGGKSLSSLEKAKKERGRLGRGQIRHNKFEIQSHNDDIDGRVKVDSWNLNYRKKKRKLKEKKVEQKVRDRMGELQNIYGVDAKTLAGMQKGQIPRQSPSKYNTHRERDHDSENSFRSTENTFMKKQQSSLNGGRHLGQHRMSTDGISNMFSFNGQKSKRWNDIESTLRGNKMDGEHGSLEKGKKSNRFGSKKKLTETQQRFMGESLQGISEDEQNEGRKKSKKHRKNPSNGSSNNSNRFGGARNLNHSRSNNQGSKSRFEDQKSEDSVEMMPTRVRGQKRMNDSHLKKGLAKGKPKKVQNKWDQNKNNNGFMKRDPSSNLNQQQQYNSNSSFPPIQRQGQQQNNDFRQGQPNYNNYNDNDNSPSHIESHEESEEAVEHQGTAFQNNDGYGEYQKLINGKGKRENVLSESNNEDEYEHTESEEGIVQDRPNFDGNARLFKKGRQGQSTDSPSQQNPFANSGMNQTDRQGMNYVISGPELSDLESQVYPGSIVQPSARVPQLQNQDYVDQSHIPNFYNYQNHRNKNTNSRGRSEGSDIEMFGFQSNPRIQYQSPYLNNQLQKTPRLRGSNSNKQHSNSSRKKAYQEEEKGVPPSSVYAEPYNVNGRIHPLVPNSLRKGQPKYISDLSDNEGGSIQKKNSSQYNSKHMTETDREFMRSKKKLNQIIQKPSNVLSPSPENVQQRSQNSIQVSNYSRRRPNLSINDFEDNYASDSQLSHSKPLQMQKVRSQLPPVHKPSHSNFQTQPAKPKRGAASQTDRDQQWRKIQEKQNERMRKMQEEDEGIMRRGAKFGDEETNTMRTLAKKKKKKQKKDWIKKEVNYWLDYDSPYAEYLVARFKEWQPQMKGHPNSTRHMSHNARKSEKINELQNVYERDSNGMARESSLIGFGHRDSQSYHGVFANRHPSNSRTVERDTSLINVRQKERKSSTKKANTIAQEKPIIQFNKHESEIIHQDDVEDL